MRKTCGTIGILGGGQLGRMLAAAAAQLGYKTHIYAPESESIAAQLANHFTSAPYEDEAALRAFADTCDVVTWEFENVPVTPLAAIRSKLAMDPRALAIAQDRLLEKNFVTEQGGKCAPYAPFNSASELIAIAAQIGLPAILKTRRDGYDGKGQWRLGDHNDLEGLNLDDGSYIYEGFVQFDAEFSVILVRGHDGEIRFWDSTHNEHVGGILRRSTLPAPSSVTTQVEAARGMAGKLADALSYVGVLTCEFFATESGPVFNEIAPRVHNSGHWTIEGASTSQFENHIRAVAGLPLGACDTVAQKVEMLNLIGDDIEDSADYLAEPHTHVHDYGKGTPSEGRKMGHVTRLYWA